MAIDIGKAYVQIVPSAQGIEGSISKLLDGESKSAGSLSGENFGANLVSKIKTIVAAAGIGKIIREAIDVGAELQQNLGGTEAVFGDFADSIQNKAKEAYANMGLSASDYMATANKMGSLFQGSGIEQQKSLELTAEAMQRAADVASVMGLDTQSAMESIAGAAKGNFTMMDNLGVAMNATTLQAYALEKGVNFNWNTASNAEKAELAMKMFMDRTSQYAGNFKRESLETISGSIGSVKAIFQDVLANLTLGEDVGPSLNNLSEAIVATANNLIPAVINIIKALPSIAVNLFEELVPQFFNEGMNMIATLTEGARTAIPDFIGQAMPMLLSFSENLRENFGQVVDAGLELIMSLMDGLIAGLPDLIAYVPQIITNIAGLINDNMPKILEKGWEIIKTLVKGIIECIPIVIANMDNIVEAIISVVKAVNWINLGKSIIQLLGNGIKILIQLPSQMMKTIIDNIKTSFKNVDWGELGRNIISGLVNGLKNGISSVVNAAKEVASSAFNAAKKKLGIASPSKMFAYIGQMSDEGLASGLEDNVNVVKKAMDDVSSTMLSPISSQASLLDYNDILYPNSYGNNIVSSETAEYNSLNEKLNRLVDLIEEYMPDIASKQLVLDSGTIVGELSDDFNKSFLKTKNKEKRGL